MTSRFPLTLKPLQLSQSMVSFSGMLLCLFPCTLMLVAAAADQSGARLIGITESFNDALGDLDAKQQLTSGNIQEKGSSGSNATIKDNTRQEFANSRKNSESFPEQGVDETNSPLIDVNEAAFTHLLSELGRFCKVSDPQHFENEVAFDFVSQAEKTDTEIQQFIAEIICTAKTQSTLQNWEFELICWAKTPEVTSLTSAVLSAEVIRSEVMQSESVSRITGLRVISSGRVWRSTTMLRPLVTVVVRRP